MQAQKGLWSHGLGDSFCKSWKKHGHHAGSPSSRDAQRSFTSWSTFRSVLNLPKSQAAMEIEAKGKREALEAQGYSLPAIDNVLHLRGIRDEYEGSGLVSSKRLNTQHKTDWSGPSVRG